MVAFVFSLLATIACGVVVVLYARRRTQGTPLSWGEANVAAVFVFFAMFLAWGILPHQWLTYADNDLQWRKDKLGIPVGPLGNLFGSANNDIVSSEGNVLFPEGIPLPNGRFNVTAEVIRDLIAIHIYVFTTIAVMVLWAQWQRRGKEKPKELPTSAFGRPLVKKA